MSAVPNRPIIQKGQKTRRKVLDFSAFALPKDVQYINHAIRQAANGQPCQFEIPGIEHAGRDTVVGCHGNGHKYGKGGARKSHDVFLAHGCSNCHSWLDTSDASAEEKDEVFQEALFRTWLHCFRTGIYGVKHG